MFLSCMFASWLWLSVIWKQEIMVALVNWNSGVGLDNIIAVVTLAALSYGIGSVWLNPLMTLRDAEPVKAVLDGFGVPENHAVWAMVALGYPLSDDQQMLKKKENVVSWVEV